MAHFDLRNPKRSRVVAGIEGKILLFYSSQNKCGKTFQACRMPKPLYIRCEQGINGINDIPMVELTNWKGFRDFISDLTNPADAEDFKQMYSTIIIDTVDVLRVWLENYICSVNGVTKLKDLPYGQGYSDYSREWFNQINKLTNSGYTVIFIAHAKEVEMNDPVSKETYTQVRPIGNDRDTKICVDIADFIGYVRPNGLDENGDEIKSSIFFASSKDFLGGSRFRFMPKVIEEFTAENVQAAIKEAVQKEEEVTGIKSISYEEKVKDEKVDKIPFDELMEKVRLVGEKLAANDHMDDLLFIVEDILGVGKKVSECTPRQYEAVETIYDALCDRVKELGLE